MNDLRIEVITEDKHYDALEPEWRKLYEASDVSTISLSWEWLREWWRIFGLIYGKDPGRLGIITIRDSEQLVAILPLYLRAVIGLSCRTLRFISTGEDTGEITYPEYLNILCENKYLDSVLELLGEYLFIKIKDEWDELNFGILAPQSPLLRLVTAPQRKIAVRLRQTRLVSYQTDLAGGLSEYLNSTSSSTRQFLRRILKQRNLPTIEFSVAASSSEANAFFTELVELHQHRWTKVGELGTFGSSNIRQFHHALIQSLLPRKGVLLTKLSIRGIPVAIIYGFITKGRFEFYQSGIDLKNREVKSPGILAHLLTMEYLAQCHLHTYDFLTGTSSYKERLATSQTETNALSFIRPTFRSVLAGVLQTCKKGAHKVARASQVFSS